MPHPSRLALPFLFASALALAACGGGDEDGNPGDSPDAASNGEDAATNGEFSTLISGAWDLPKGTEAYKCARLTLQEDTYITGFRSLGPQGTHHTVLTVGAVSGPDGIEDCGPLTNAESMIFGSGIGDIEFNFPEGVGIKIAAGQQLLLNLHLYNYGDTDLSETSGTLARFATAADIVSEAESVLIGKISNLTVAPGISDQVGQCTMERDVTLLNVSPHMHALGSHMKVVAKTDAGDQLLHDAPYDFLDQKLYVLPEPLQLGQGDRIEVTCTYDNDTGETVNYGNSSDEEMCFAGMYRYPKRVNSPTDFACLF